MQLNYISARITPPSAAVSWTEINYDTSCDAFRQAFIDAVTNGNDAGAQDMVWTQPLIKYGCTQV